MKSNLLTVVLLLVYSTSSLAAPQPITDIQVISREDAAALDARHSNIFEDASDLWKRKGGGGGGGKGGGSGSSGGGKGGSGSSSGGKGSSSSSTGGSTKQGSGTQPTYGGGKYYGGGATTPYGSGATSPRGIAPIFIGGAALAVFPGIWLYGAYAYPYHNPYTFYNRTARRNSTSTRRDLDTNTVSFFKRFIAVRQDDTTTTGANQTKPVQCLCAAYAECGCDDNGDTTFLESVIGDGTYSKLNQSLVTVVDYPNGTSQIVLNGTLENGTTVAGGTEDAFGSASRLLEASGYWVMIALVGCTVLLV